MNLDAHVDPIRGFKVSHDYRLIMIIVQPGIWRKGAAKCILTLYRL